jgi:membrane peptidoglycan carboxypeptidase
MEEYGTEPPQNGFQSRDLGSNAQPPRRPLRAAAPVRVRRQVRNGESRVTRIIAFLKARGRKRLIRDTVLVVVGIGLLYTLILWFTLPDISDPRSLIASQSSVITDRDGVELYRLYGDENRTFVPGDQIPENLQHAIVAIEDERYYSRGCLDVRAIARVFFRFGQAGGASTLTRQLARNALDLNNENIISRKAKEVILGCQLESKYSKNDLLNLYLNWVPFGPNVYGVELASRTYFNVPVKDLTLAQSAVLAALPQRPSYLSPYGKHVHTEVTPAVQSKIISGKITKTSQIPEEDITIGLLGGDAGTGTTTVYVGGRTDQVLKNMEDLGFITEAERLAALQDLHTMQFTPYREDIRAAHFVLWVKSQVEDLLGGDAEEGVLNQGGLTIETTLDWDIQQEAEKLIAAKREDIGSVYGAHNIALVSVKTGTNEIMAYVGNADYNDDEHDGKVDMARAPRQPGSSFKPFVYATAFKKGYGPGTVLYDVPTKFGTDQPQNFDGTFWGLTTVRKALGGSRNIPAIKAFFLAGEEGPILETAADMGVTTPREQKQEFKKDNPDFEYGWPLALGAAEAPLTEMVQGYSTFANGGISKPLTGIRKITDRRGNILYEAQENDGTQALDPGIAYEITSILSDASARPNEFWQTVLSVPGFQSAAKTGTSNKCLDRAESGGCTERRPSDLWTMGFTPNLVTGVWMGNADATPLSPKAESLSQASPLWKDFMIRAHKTLENPVTGFTAPSDIVQPQISTLSGQLPTECTPVEHRISDVFLAKNAPNQEDPACVRLTVDKVTGLLASDECPAEAAEERSFFQPQEVLAARFPQWQASVIEWAKSKMSGYDPVTGTFATGTVLPLPLAPTESCTMSLTPGRQSKPTLMIDYPKDNGTAPYPSFQPRIDYNVSSEVREIRFELDGKPAGSVSTAPFSIPIQVPRSVKESGEHTLTVTLVDKYYNEATDAVTFRFEEDHNAPEIRFTSPRGDLTAKTGETLVLEVDAQDDEGGIKYVQFYLDTRLLTTKPQAPYKLDWKQDLNPGTYEIRAVATDLAGNESEESVMLTIE